MVNKPWPISCGAKYDRNIYIYVNVLYTIKPKQKYAAVLLVCLKMYLFPAYLYEKATFT